MAAAIKLVKASGAFDERFYKVQLKRNQIKSKNPIEHYLDQGWKSGLNPHPCFDTAFYLEDNVDVQTLNLHPFLHFIMFGYKEHRSTKKGFELSRYRSLHPELNSFEINPLSHYTKSYGQMEPPLQTSKLGELPLSIARSKAHQPAGLLAEALRLGLFDPAWYSETYNIAFASASDAFADYLDKSRFAPVNPSPLFDNEIYHRTNTDVYHAQLSPLEHYITSGREEGRSISATTQKWCPTSVLDVEHSLTPEAAALKVAVCLHIYYGDYIERFAEALEHFPVSIDVLITLTDPDLLARAKDTFTKNSKVNRVIIKCVPNRGRNFGPLLVEYAADISNYDLFCHLHSKKSLYSGREQTQWADYLTEFLIREPAVTTRALNAFASHEDIGIYYPTTFWMMPSWVNHVTMNKHHMKQWTDSWGIEQKDGFMSYPAGGMFWARPKALESLLTANHEYSGFPAEPLPNDGSSLHGLERAIAVLVEHNNYKQLYYYPASDKFTHDESYATSSYRASMEEIYSQLRVHSHISFDVFDTLVRREYTVPDYAKFLLGRELTERGLIDDPNDFIELRNHCELQLRIESNFQGDVRISEIYTAIGRHLKLSDPEAQSLMTKEFEIDLGMIKPKEEMVALFNKLIRDGHKIWVISDSYYSRDQVGLMLRKVGVSGAYRLLVSSEEQKRKDNGTMWRMIKADLEQEQAPAYIHVGDNVVADAQIPGDLGLLTMHILHPLDKWKALGFPNHLDGGTPFDEYGALKWGKLVSCVGRVPFL